MKGVRVRVWARIAGAGCLAVVAGAPEVWAQNVGPRNNPIGIPTTRPSVSAPAEGQRLAGPGAYVTGKVIVEGGGELPLNVVIEKVCGSRRTALGYADRKGNFSVRLTGNSLAALLDASDDARAQLGSAPPISRDQGGNNLIGCEIQAMSPGYRSRAADIGSQRSLDNPNIGNLMIRRISTGEGSMVSQTMLTAPKNALKAYESGMDALRKGNLAIAEKEFDKAVNLHPAFANAWYELGHLHLQIANNKSAARGELDKAVAADPKYVLPYADLAALAYGDKNWAETIRVSAQGLHLDATGIPVLHFYNAAAQFRAGNLPEAEKHAREAERLDYEHTLGRTPQLLSYILVTKGDFAGAAEQMRTYIASGISSEEAERSRKQLAEIEKRVPGSPKPTPQK